jgi:hypothetical protein
MTIKTPLAPSYTQGQTVTPAAAAASITIGKGSKSLCLTNTGSNVCYVRVGPSGIEATTADYPVIAGIQTVISKDQDHDTLSYISASGTTLHAIPGEGF